MDPKKLEFIMMKSPRLRAWKHTRDQIKQRELTRSRLLIVLSIVSISFNAAKATASDEAHQPKVVHPHLSARQLAAPSIWKTHTTYDASALTWSPDGRWATYKLTESRDLATTESLDIAANSDWERISLCRIRADGRGARRLYSEGMDVEIAGWSPNSQRVLFWTRAPHSDSANADGSRLYDVAVTGGKVRLLTTPFRSTDGYMDDHMMRGSPVFSHNGKYLLLIVGSGRHSTHNKRLALLSYPSGRKLWITEPSIAVNDFDWSPDGKRITLIANPDPSPEESDLPYTNGPYNDDWRQSRAHLWVMDTSGHRLRQLTADPHYFEMAPTWVHGSHSIRFSRFQNSDANDSDWEINADGRELQRFHNPKSSDPGRKSQDGFDTARLNAVRR
jgi:Tol biopolymer transport system component